MNMKRSSLKRFDNRITGPSISDIVNNYQATGPSIADIVKPVASRIAPRPAPVKRVGLMRRLGQRMGLA
jgi:hypothetical protein